MSDELDEQITEMWLSDNGWEIGGLRVSRFLPVTHEGSSIVELSLTPDGEIPRVRGLPSGKNWTASLVQKDPEDPEGFGDHVVLTSLVLTTKRHVVNLFAALTGVNQ